MPAFSFLILALLLMAGTALAGEAEPKPRAPTPDAAQQRNSEKIVREIYSAGFAQSAPSEKLALSKKLLAQLEVTKDDDAGHYALLTLAANLSAQGGSLDELMAISDRLAARFEGDASSVLKNNLGILASASRDPNIAKLALAYKTLFDKPDDANACLAVGSHQCFVKGNFERGLPLLAKSSAPALSSLAKQDLAQPKDFASQIAVGDGWWELSENPDSVEKKRFCQERAAIWYIKAIPNITGLNKVKIQKRIDSTDAGLTGLAGVQPNQKVVDLMALIDPARDAIRGDWKMEDGVLVCSSVDRFQRLQIPYRPGAEYDINAVFSRTSGEDDVGFFFVSNKTQVLLSLCGWTNKFGGIHNIKGLDPGNKKNPTQFVSSISNNKDNALELQVRKQSIRAVLNGKEVMNHRFEVSDLTAPNREFEMRDQLALGLCTAVSTVKFSALVVVEHSSPGLLAAAPDPAPKGKVVDLLKMIEPGRDGFSGVWKKDGDKLVCGLRTSERLQLPYVPGTEYELRVNLKTLAGDDAVYFSLLQNGYRFIVHLGGWNNHCSGLTMIKGVWADKNATRSKFTIENKRNYSLTMKVLKDSVQVFADGKMIIEHRSDGSDFSSQADWHTPHQDAIGIGSARSVEFESIQLIEISGSGQAITSWRYGQRAGERGPSNHFQDIAPKNGMLSGFKIWWKGGRKEYIDGLQPIYKTPTGRFEGKFFGTVTGAPKLIEAKAGYAVGDMSVRSAGRIDAIKLVFMKVDAGALDPKDKYDSEWIGGTNSGEWNYDFHGPAIGVYGTKLSELESFGLLFAPPKTPGN